MKLKNIIFLVLGLYLFNFSLAFAVDERMITGDEYSKKIITLNWKFSEQEDGETIQIKNTNASVILVKDEAIIQGKKDVNQYTWWSFGQAAEGDDIAIIRGLGDYSYSFYLAYSDDGFISLDDWKEVDASSLINQLRETAKKNAEYYKSQNLEYVKNIDWIFKPTLNDEFKTVSYSYKVVWSDNNITMITDDTSIKPTKQDIIKENKEDEDQSKTIQQIDREKLEKKFSKESKETLN